MSISFRLLAVLILFAGVFAVIPADIQAQRALEYDVEPAWAQLPSGRTWGAVTGVHVDPDSEHIWVLDRCGANSCLGSSLDPLFKFTLDGTLVGSYGAGLFAWPHGLFVDNEGSVWITDAGTGARGEEAARHGLGHQILKLDPNGEVLLRLGRAGVAGAGKDTFDGPSAVLVAPTGEIFVADGHGQGGNNRIVKFGPDGGYLIEWGTGGPGPAAGEFNDAHALALDSRGRLYIGDRGNNRIQIYDQNGTFIEDWTHFGPPSAIFIDANDVIYVTDTQTAALPQWIAERRSSDWTRFIRIGNALTGEVTGVLESEAEFVAADPDGNVYGAEVPGQRLIRYSRKP